MKEHNLMSSFELNKIMGAIFSVVLVLLVIKNLGNTLYIEDNSFHNTKIKETSILTEVQIKPESDNIIIDIEERLINADLDTGKVATKKCGACKNFKKMDLIK